MAKKSILRKTLSAFTAMAMSTSILIGVPFDFGVTVEANAEDYNPSVITYATAEQLGDSTTFAPKLVNGVGNNIAKIYFGEKDGNPVSWYILGGDSSVSGNNMMLFATTNLASGKRFRTEPNGSDPTAMPYEDGDGDYSGTAPDSVYANHYGASDLREYFNNMATDSGVFSEEEQALLNETTITTYDVKNDTSYTTTDKLYALQVVGNALCIGPEDTMLNRGTYWEDGVFLSRTPNVNIDFDNYEENSYCRWIYIMNVSGTPITSTMSNLYNGYRPATNIDLSDVLFASCAAVGTTSEYYSNTYISNNSAPLTLRLDGSDKNIGTVTYAGDTITAKKGTTTETVAIVVQGKDNNSDWSCSKVITGTETITKEDIENSSGSFTVSGELSDCRIWLEIVSEDNLRYAVTAKQAQTITADDVTLVYDDTNININATTNGDGALSYEVATGEDVISVTADGMITALKAGTATVTINAAETDTYAAASKTITVTVNNPSTNNNNNNNNSSTGSNSSSSSSSKKSPSIEGKSGRKGWSAISDVIEDTKEGGKVSIDMNDVTELPKNILSEIKGRDIEIVLNMDNGFVWTINGKDVENPKTIDMGVKKGSTIPVKVINEVTGECEYITLTLSHNGDFGFKAVLTVDTGKNNKGFFANLYYYNGEETEIISSDEIDENGKADLTFTHASEYVIVIDDTDHTDLSAGESIKVEEIMLG